MLARAIVGPRPLTFHSGLSHLRHQRILLVVIPAKAGIHWANTVLFEAWTPAFALVDAHISEAPSVGEGVEVFEAVPEGDGSGFGAWVSVPAQAARLMGVALELCPALVLGTERGEGLDFSIIEGIGGGFGALAIARLEELQDDGGGLGGDGGELEQSVGRLDPAVFQL